MLSRRGERERSPNGTGIQVRGTYGSQRTEDQSRIRDRSQHRHFRRREHSRRSADQEAGTGSAPRDQGESEQEARPEFRERAIHVVGLPRAAGEGAQAGDRQ